MAVAQYLEHFLFKPEVSWGTFVAPDKVIPIEMCDIASRRGIIVSQDTGYGRSQNTVIQGEKPVNGPLRLAAYPSPIVSLLKTFMASLTSTQQAPASAYRHALSFDDANPLGSFSAEKQYGSDVSQFLKGCIITKMTLTAPATDKAIFNFDVIAKDECWDGGNWDDDGTAGPASPTSPVTYASPLPLPFYFVYGRVTRGGTLALTNGEIVVTGGTDLAYVTAAEVSVSIPQVPVFGHDEQPCAAYIRENGDREVLARLDLDWIATEEAWIAYQRDKTETVIQLKFETDIEIDTGYNYEMLLTLPRAVPAEGQPPAIEGAKGVRSHQVLYRGMYEETTTDLDFGLVIQNGIAAP